MRRTILFIMATVFMAWFQRGCIDQYQAPRCPDWMLEKVEQCPDGFRLVQCWGDCNPTSRHLLCVGENVRLEESQPWTEADLEGCPGVLCSECEKE